LFFIYQKLLDFQAKTEILDKSYTQYQQDLLSDELENVMKYIYFEYSVFDEKAKNLAADSRKTALSEFEKSLIAKLDMIKFGKSAHGSIFLINTDGICLFYPSQKNLQGKKISDLKIAGEKPYEKMMYNAQAETGDFLDYTPLNKKNTMTQYMTFSKSFKPLQWIVCAEISKEEFQMAVAENVTRLKIDIFIEIIFICLLALLVTLAATYFIYSFSKAFKKEINLLVEYQKTALSENKELTENQFTYSEFRFIASSAINMVTQIKELLFKLKELAMRSEVNSQAKSTFLTSLGHDFRNSMNVIMGMTRILSESKLDEEQSNCVKSIHNSNKTLHSLINAISDFTSMQSGSLEIAAHDFDMSKLLEHTKEMAAEKLSSINVMMNLSIDPRIPAILQGDNRRIRQIMITLMSTALHYTKEGSQFDFHVGNRKTEEKTNTIIFTMVFQTKKEDIPGSLPLEKIFDFNTDLLKMANQSIGTGFALAVCKYLVELMNGSISFERIDSEKAKISFSLPLATGTLPAGMPVETKDTVKTEAAADMPKVLLVEDDLINQKIEYTFLTRLNCKVDTALNGVEAVKMYKKGNYNIIFMDCQMPEMNGYDASKAIRELEKNTNLRIPIIALTADASQKDLETAKNAGMDDHLAKPVAIEELASALSKYTSQGALI
jgi:CheY-like chemotaxis protein/signal transduction histidine kinase